jgi:2-dehydropantoate 2-reductase
MSRFGMTHRVAVLGPGALGGALVAQLANAGVHTVCVPHRDMVNIVALAGLTLEVDGGEPIVVRPEVRHELTQPVDVLLVTVKAYQLAEALEQIDPAAVADAVVLPLLNGLEHIDVLRARFGARVAAGSIAHFEAYRVGRVQIIQTTPSATITMASEEIPGPELERAAGILMRGGFEVRLEHSERQVLWDKAARLAVLAAATSLTHRSVGGLLDDPGWRYRVETAIAEACDIAVADGADVLPSTQWSIIGGMDYDLTTSTARDVAEGRPSELDAIAGAVVRAGSRLGVPCPALTELYVEASAHAAEIAASRD